MAFETIIYEKKDNVAWITLNRPDKLNAQNDTLRSEVIAALEQANSDDEVRVIVITGAGDRAFSAGADIGQFPEWQPLNVIQRSKGARRPYTVIREIPKPVIAMVNGLALGGGCELAMACDIIIASDKARFGQPEINVGVIPGGGGTQILPRLVGEKKAKEMVFTGEFISAEEAWRLGMVNKVVPADKLKEAVEEIIAKLKSKSPAILKLAKIAVNRSLETPLSVGMEIENELFAMCFGTQDQKEGARAFLEKRPPNYKGV
jgi:enoyl-CoA hydratase